MTAGEVAPSWLAVARRAGMDAGAFFALARARKRMRRARCARRAGGGCCALHAEVQALARRLELSRPLRLHPREEVDCASCRRLRREAITLARRGVLLLKGGAS